MTLPSVPVQYLDTRHSPTPPITNASTNWHLLIDKEPPPRTIRQHRQCQPTRTSTQIGVFEQRQEPCTLLTLYPEKDHHVYNERCKLPSNDTRILNSQSLGSINIRHNNQGSRNDVHPTTGCPRSIQDHRRSDYRSRARNHTKRPYTLITIKDKDYYQRKLQGRNESWIGTPFNIYFFLQTPAWTTDYERI
jgi:hypothetical protein